MNTMQHIGKTKMIQRNIREAIEDSGVTVKDLAEKAHMSKQAIYDIIKKDLSIIRKGNIQKLAKALQVPQEYLSDENVYYDKDFFYATAQKAFNVRYPNQEAGLDETLAIETSINPVDFFNSRLMPDEQTQNQIAQLLNVKPGELFRSIGRFQYEKISNKVPKMDMSKDDEVDLEKINKLLIELDNNDRKLVYNLAVDLVERKKN